MYFGDVDSVLSIDLGAHITVLSSWTAGMMSGSQEVACGHQYMSGGVDNH